MEEEKVHCFCILLLGPKSCSKFCSIKTRHCCLLSVLPSLAPCSPSQPLNISVWDYSINTIAWCGRKLQRPRIFPSVLSLAWRSSSSSAVGNSSDSSFLIPSVLQSLWRLHCPRAMSPMGKGWCLGSFVVDFGQASGMPASFVSVQHGLGPPLFFFNSQVLEAT